MKRVPVNIDDLIFPDELKALCEGADIYDSSCSREARVLFIDRDGGYFLKISNEGSLLAEAAMTKYFHSLSLSAEVLFCGSRGGSDWLLTRRIPGEDCTDRRYLSDPERLCDTTASLLRRLHSTPAAGCPVKYRTAGYIRNVTAGFDGSHYEPDLFSGLWEFSSFEEAKREAEAGLSQLKSDVLIHGDYCLPNIILDGWRFSGFIDIGNGGMGDRHIDVLWGIWTLKFNLGTAKYTDRFIDAYGREMIDPCLLRRVAAMEMIGG